MKRLIIALTLLLSKLILVDAQPPQAIKYKSIAKDEWGVALPNKDISLQFTFLQDGIEVYRELHYTTTNKFGLMDVNIGEGTASLGVFRTINWGTGTYSMRVELDPNGGSDFRLEGEDRLLSVPYALYAGNVNGSSDADPDPTNELITDMYLSGTELYIVEAGQVHMLDLVSLQDGTVDADADPTNELQDISLSGNSLSISQRSTVDLGSLPDLVEDADADPLNEIQNLQLQGNILTITGNSSSTTINLGQYLDNSDDQLLSLEGNELSIEGGNAVNLTDLVDDADADPTNELQDISLSESSLSISNGSTVDLSFIPDGYEPDTDNQTLNVDGYNLSISNGNTMILPDEVIDGDNDPINEIQTLSIDGNVLTLSDGGVVELTLGSGVGGVYMFADADEDGFGDPFTPVFVPDGVVSPVGYTTESGDCNDYDPSINPGATEVCGDGIDQDCDGSDLECPSVVDIRIAISNTTSGIYQSYDPGHGIRLMQGVNADILLVQECQYGSNTSSDLQAFNNLLLGSGYYSIGSGSLPNCIISRYPIINEGSIVDPAVSNRDIRWAVVDIPGYTNLIAYSVHFSTDLSSAYTAFELIKDHVSSQLAASEPGNYYFMVGGTFWGNLSTTSSMLANSVFEMPTSLPMDDYGVTGTNAARSNPDDYLIFDASLNNLEIPTTYGDGNLYQSGMVFDSRNYDQTTLDWWFSPTLTTDSGALNMQHMIVVRTVSISVP